MSRLTRLGTSLTSALLLIAGVSHCAAQEAAAPAESAEPTAKSGAEEAGKYRKLAPGVLKTADTVPEIRDTFSATTHDIVELLAVDPEFDWAKEKTFRHDVWYLNFQFKQLRIARVDLPQPGGNLEPTLVYYLLYAVTNPGKALHPAAKDDGTYDVESVDKPIRFAPQFQIHSPEFNYTYPERIIPLAIPVIQAREDSRRPLLTTVEMCREIKVGETIWGVATWEGVDPRIDHFEVLVQGLTNAYRWEDAAEFKAGDPPGTGRTLACRTLRINFWRPGDEFFVHEGEIRYGFPGKVDYDWIYQ
jgi:hypothetical protein